MQTAADRPSSAQVPGIQENGTIQSRTRRPIFRIAGGLVAFPVLFAALWAALWPVTFNSREEIFDIPKGTWARHMAGDKHDTLPSEIDLLTGIHNVLLLKNSDDVPQMFGPTLLMPGQTLRIPFTRPSENSFSCTAHASGQMLIVVEAAPAWPWERLSWRVRRMLRGLSTP
jgi:hypothetical protein